ncbi:MAG: protein kinase, partial [Actinomycetota bacterium]|nr:protein kinase [Actinomycetota bacterium]
MQQLVDNRYRIVQPLGNGGMAEVYLAHDDILDRDVALKVMSGRYAGDEEFVERFKREAQSAAALSHPNIVSIFDRGAAEDGTYYIAMEYLPGGTLKDRITKRGAIPPRTAAAVALQIAGALCAAHERGVIHRDIKPHNILITESGDVKVTDFGIARAASSSTMTRTGSILGTAHYISPEQAMGEPVGPASDLYSLGVVLYEMLTGELPFDAETPLGIAMKHVSGHLRPPKEVNPQVPEG